MRETPLGTQFQAVFLFSSDKAKAISNNKESPILALWLKPLEHLKCKR